MVPKGRFVVFRGRESVGPGYRVERAHEEMVYVHEH